MQDNWEVELILKGQKLAREARPIFLSLQGEYNALRSSLGPYFIFQFMCQVVGH